MKGSIQLRGQTKGSAMSSAHLHAHWGHHLLLEQAKDSLTRGGASDLQMAVILARSAIELCKEVAFDALLKKRPLEGFAEWLAPRRGGYNPGGKDVATGYAKLTQRSGGTFAQTDKPTWDVFADHEKRRYSVVHRGTSADAAGGAASAKLVEGLMALIELDVSEVRSSP